MLLTAPDFFYLLTAPKGEMFIFVPLSFLKSYMTLYD